MVNVFRVLLLILLLASTAYAQVTPEGYIDQDTFSSSTVLTPQGCVFDDGLSALASGTLGTCRTTPNRAPHINLRNDAGTEIGTAGAPIRVDPTGTTTQSVSIPDLVTSGSITSTESVTLASTGAAGIKFSITGTWTGTIKLEQTIDGSTYFSFAALPFSQLSPQNSNALAGSFTANGQWLSLLAGVQSVRLRGDSVTSGTAVVTIRASQFAPLAAVFTVNDGFVDVNNSTTTPLGSGGTFTGAATDMLPYMSGRVNIFTDVDSATDGVKLQFSSDGINWDHVRTATFDTADVSMLAPFGRTARYFRLVYTNGGSAQGAFRVQTIMQRDSVDFSRAFINTPPDFSDTALLAQSVIIGETTAGGGSFVGVKVNPSGSLTVAGTADTELPPAALLSDDTVNPTVPAVGSFGHVWDGATWDRMPGSSADGVLVNLGTNNDVTVTGTVTANQGTAAVATGGWPIAAGVTAESTATWTSATGVNTTLTVALANQYQATRISGTVTGSISSGSALFEGSTDGSVYQTLACFEFMGTTTLTTSRLLLAGYAITTGNSRTFLCQSTGLTNVRLRLNPVIVGAGSIDFRVIGVAHPAHGRVTVVPENTMTGAVGSTLAWLPAMPAVANTAAPSRTEAEASPLSVDSFGKLRVITDTSSFISLQRATVSAVTSVAASASNVTCLASNANRLGATISNDSTADLFLKLGSTASSSSYTVRLFQDSYFRAPAGYTGVIDCIWASATGNARVTELTP